jgi:hypothetical protein
MSPSGRGNWVSSMMMPRNGGFMGRLQQRLAAGILARRHENTRSENC